MGETPVDFRGVGKNDSANVDRKQRAAGLQIDAAGT